MTDTDRRPILDKEVLLPISLVAAPLIFSFWLGSRLNALDSRLANIERTLDDVGTRKVSLGDFRAWRADLQLKNPTLDVPIMKLQDN